MSQQTSSIVSHDNPEIKYKKALKEISKLIQANRTLRENSQKTTRELNEKINELSLRYQDLVREYDSVRKEKESLSSYLDEIQKERNNLDRQVAYLNDVVQENSAELKKLNLHKDEHAVAALIRTYEQKQVTMNRTRVQNEEIIASLKSAYQRLENELHAERNGKEEYEDRYKVLSLEMNRYKQQNSSLLDQIQRLLRESSKKDSYCVQKQKELRLLVSQFQKQVSMLKNAQQQSYKLSRNNSQDQVEQILTEKNRIEIEFAKLQNAYEQLILRDKQFYEMQEKWKNGKLQVERANDQLNMLKSKIVVLQAKQFLEEAGDEDYDQKEFEERLNVLISQNDPIHTIRNQEDSSHFRIMKGFIVDLQDKILRVTEQKKELSKKYKSMKVKFVKNAEQLVYYEDQNKLMKGKLQGYQRLSQKLHYELQKQIHGHEQEITRMTITSNNIITRKVEQYKATINLLNSQLEMNQDKAQRADKNYKQQIETLKLEVDTLKIKINDQSDKLNKDNQLIDLYKKKNTEIVTRIGVLQEQLSNNSDNLSRFEQLYKQEKGKNQGLLVQKQQLIVQVKQFGEQIDKKSASLNNNNRVKQQQFEFDLKKTRIQNQKLRDDVEQYTREIQVLQKELDERRRGDQSEVEEIRRQAQKILELENKVSELKRKVREVEDENESMRIKNKKFQDNYNRINKYEEENISKGDQINDLSREKIILESELKNIQSILGQEKKQNQEYKKQLSNLKMKALETNHESKRELQGKIFENKKMIQTLNQDISDLTTELREQKSKNVRISNELNTQRGQKNRLQQLIDQNRKRDLQNESQVGNIKIDLSNAQLEIEKLRSQIKSYQFGSNQLNKELENLQQKIFVLNQEVSSYKMKFESAQDERGDLVKDLNSLKFNFVNIQTHTSQAKININLPWNQQNFYNGLSDVLNKIRKIFRNYDIKVESSSYGSTGGSFTGSVAPISSKIEVNRGDTYKDYFKSYAEPEQRTNSIGEYNYRMIGETNSSVNYSYETRVEPIGESTFDYTKYLSNDGQIGGESWRAQNYEYATYSNEFDQGGVKNRIQ